MKHKPIRFIGLAGILAFWIGVGPEHAAVAALLAILGEIFDIADKLKV